MMMIVVRGPCNVVEEQDQYQEKWYKVEHPNQVLDGHVMIVHRIRIILVVLILWPMDRGVIGAMPLIQLKIKLVIVLIGVIITHILIVQYLVVIQLMVVLVLTIEILNGLVSV